MWITRKTKLCIYICLALVLLFLCMRLEDGIINSVKDTNKLKRYETTDSRPGIPRIIHLIWNNETLPNEFVENVRSFLKNNPVPRWEYYFWTKDSGLKFIKEKYSDFYPRVSSEHPSSGFIRADVLRYLVLHEYGGFYYDLDTVSVQPLDDYAATHECSLALEPGEHYFLWNTDMLISNAALMCVQQHPFYKLIISKLSQQHSNCTDAFMCTGPNFITSLYRAENQTAKTRSRLPDLQPSEVFQDAYDVKMNDGFLKERCADTTKLPPHLAAICDKWRERGMGTRELSPKALTHHTWYHTNMYPVSFSKENAIFNIVPDVKIYGRNLNN